MKSASPIFLQNKCISQHTHDAIIKLLRQEGGGQLAQSQMDVVNMVQRGNDGQLYVLLCMRFSIWLVQGTQLDACLCACRGFMGYGGSSMSMPSTTGYSQPAAGQDTSQMLSYGQPVNSMAGGYQGMQGHPANGMAGGYQGMQAQPDYQGMQGMQGHPATSMAGGYQGLQGQPGYQGMQGYLPAQGVPVQVGCVLTMSAATSGLREVMQHLCCISASLSTVLHASTCK